MSKVFISRQDGTVSWGFRLQGGLEYNEPLTVTNILPNSPADGKLDPGDMLTEIAGNNVTHMTHRDALELIQRCANALFLTVHKVGYSYPPGGAAPRPAPITSTWKPSAQQQPPPSYYQQDFQPPQQQPQQPPYYQQNFQQQQQQPPYYQHDFQPQQQYGYGQPPAPMFNAPPPPPPPPPPPMPAANVPAPPIFDADLIANAAASLKNRPLVTETHTSYEQTTDISNIPAALAKSLGRPGGPKPFTYTPGGLDLSKIRESARVRRHREYVSNSEEPNETQESEINMSRRMNVPPAPMTQHQYVPPNPVQQNNYNRQQAAPAKKNIQPHDTDVVTQSRSFQMLQGWISDSEKTVPTPVPPPSQPAAQPTNRSAVARAVLDEQIGNTNRQVNSGNTASLPSRSFRYLQEQYKNGNSDNTNVVTTTTTTTTEETMVTGEGMGLRRGSASHMPSRSFKYIQDQYDSQQAPVNRPQGINNRDDLVEIYNKPPPSFREREPEAPRYTGSTVPSRSFRFLQMMTQDDQQNDSKPVPGYNKPQQLMNKYDEQNTSFNTNKINTHPSRSFKYLQEMTSEQQPVLTTMTTVTRTERRISATNNGQPLKMNVEIQQSQPIVQINTISSSSQDPIIDNLAADIAATDF